MRGFTLVEVLIATLLIGLSITALMVANGSFSMANAAGADLSTAEFLVEQIRELTTMLPVLDPETDTTTFGPEETGLSLYDDVDDFDVKTFSPPINARREVISAFADLSQAITVENVNPSNFDLVVGDHASDFIRVTVRILQNNRQISSASWIRARY